MSSKGCMILALFIRKKALERLHDCKIVGLSQPNQQMIAVQQNNVMSTLAAVCHKRRQLCKCSRVTNGRFALLIHMQLFLHWKTKNSTVATRHGQIHANVYEKNLITYPSYNCSVKLYIYTVYRMRLHAGSTSLLALILHEWHFSQEEEFIAISNEKPP